MHVREEEYFSYFNSSQHKSKNALQSKHFCFKIKSWYLFKKHLNLFYFSGTTRCSCSIFVWEQSTKIIISDIDGTITKSDVRGMILPMIGRLLVHEHHYSIIYFVC